MLKSEVSIIDEVFCSNVVSPVEVSCWERIKKALAESTKSIPNNAMDKIACEMEEIITGQQSGVFTVDCKTMCEWVRQLRQ